MIFPALRSVLTLPLIVDKFEKLAVHALPKARVAELRDAVLKLEQLADAAELAALMAT